MQREDGRQYNQIRALESEQALLNKADGSAKFSQTAVYGPVEVKIPRKEKISKALVELSFSPSGGVVSYEDKEREMLIRNAVESVIITLLHPRTQVSIIIQVYADDGSIVSCSINAACLALMDAGIELNGLLSSVTLGFTHENRIMIDPSTKEEKSAKGIAIYSFNNQSSLVMCKTTGVIAESAYLEGLALARSSCEKILAYIGLAVKNRIMGDTNTNNKVVAKEAVAAAVEEPMQQ
eukprot:gene15322-18151_t